MSLMYIMMLCIIYYNTCIFNTVLYTIMCMISINNNNNKADCFVRMLHIRTLKKYMDYYEIDYTI